MFLVIWIIVLIRLLQIEGIEVELPSLAESYIFATHVLSPKSFAACQAEVLFHHEFRIKRKALLFKTFFQFNYRCCRNNYLLERFFVLIINFSKNWDIEFNIDKLFLLTKHLICEVSYLTDISTHLQNAICLNVLSTCKLSDLDAAHSKQAWCAFSPALTLSKSFQKYITGRPFFKS